MYVHYWTVSSTALGLESSDVRKEKNERHLEARENRAAISFSCIGDSFSSLARLRSSPAIYARDVSAYPAFSLPSSALRRVRHHWLSSRIGVRVSAVFQAPFLGNAVHRVRRRQGELPLPHVSLRLLLIQVLQAAPRDSR